MRFLEGKISDRIQQHLYVRNLEGGPDIDHLPNPMHKENRKHFRFEVGRIYYQAE